MIFNEKQIIRRFKGATKKLLPLIMVITLNFIPIKIHASLYTDKRYVLNPVTINSQWFDGKLINTVYPIMTLDAYVKRDSDYKVLGSGDVKIGIYIDSEGTPRFSIVENFYGSTAYNGVENGIKVGINGEYNFKALTTGRFGWWEHTGKESFGTIKTNNIPDKILNEQTNKIPLITINSPTSTQLINK